MAINELAQKFDQVWDKFTSGNTGIAIPAVDGTKYQHSGVITSEDGKNEIASVITHEIPYVPGSLRPHMRKIDISLSDGKTVVVSDVSIHVFPNRKDNVYVLDAIERFHPA